MATERERIELEGMTGASEDGSPGERTTQKTNQIRQRLKSALQQTKQRQADTGQLAPEDMLTVYGDRSAVE